MIRLPKQGSSSWQCGCFVNTCLASGRLTTCLRHNGSSRRVPSSQMASLLRGVAVHLAWLQHAMGPLKNRHAYLVTLTFSSGSCTIRVRLGSVAFLTAQTGEARALLRGWQERTLSFVQSIQLDSAAVLPLLLDDRCCIGTHVTHLDQHRSPCNTRRIAASTGEEEDDARDASKCRPLVATEEF